MKTYPVDEIISEFKQTVLRSPSVILQAPPGAGKTTRVPLALLDIIPPEQGRIIMLEPRRIAAVSAARWMAQTLGEQAGETIGYAIRFDRKVSGKTRIEVVTEGILTRRIQSDAALEGVAAVIFDEFHERSIHADLSLALCLDIQKNLREDLRIIVMSATLDCGPVSTLLGDAPVIRSEGRIFPVEERYLAGDNDRPIAERVLAAVVSALKETSGDILAFLPGTGEIRSSAGRLQSVVDHGSNKITVHPLYGDLPFEEQEKAILPAETRKVVLATNIAETSLTIEGVQVVIDSGLTRRLRYDSSTGMNRLVTGTISRASAEQRKGRAGRLGPGVCYRLYSRHVFQSMLPFALPEILTSDLSPLALELAVWGIKEPSGLSWLDEPPPDAWESARRLLADLGALAPSGSVTPAGKAMVRLPLHPRLSRLLIRADEIGCPGVGADLAALLSERDIIVRGRPDGQTDGSDINEKMDILSAWRKTGNPPACADPWALRTVEKISKQLLRLISGPEKTSAKKTGGPDMIPRLLLAAFPDRVARLREDGNGRFLLSQGRGVRISTAGSLARSPFIIALNLDAGEKAEGTVHVGAPLTEEMIRQEAAHCIRTVRRVEWDRREGRIVAAIEEQLGAILLSSKPFNPSDRETVPILCDTIRSTPGLIEFGRETRQFKARVSLIKRAFPEEDWPDLSDEALLSSPEAWLLPWLSGMRSARDISVQNILPALKEQLAWEKMRLLDSRAPTHITVPSGSRISLDYSVGDIPVLAVKLQEMFGLADSPVIAEGRVKMLLHLLSPARRPVQITQDLKGFWDSGYQQVKRELKGRYPKHPWPDDPWNALPTRRLKPKGT